MFIIRCKPFLLNRLILTLLFGGSVLLLAMLLQFYGSYFLDLIPFLSLWSLGSVFLTFYLTKNEVYTITVSDDEIHLDFFNKSIFKRVPMKFNKGMFTYVHKSDYTDLQIESNVIARIRKRTMSDEEWQKLNHFLNS